MTTNPFLSRFAGQDALVEPSQTARFEACLASVVEHPRFGELATIVSDDEFWVEDDDSLLALLRPYTVIDGILQIPVKGVLLNNFPYAFFDYATGYEYIWQAFKRGCGDFATGAIKGIALVCDTPGGMVAGCFDMVDRMVALKEKLGVPVAGFAHESAYSAGYATISVADTIYVSRTGGVGSIGVVTGHMDVSGAMEKAGLKFTYIASDPSKVEGNPYEALSADAKARIQARIDELYGIFVAAVARSRGIDEAVIRDDLKAYCYTATQAVSNGLADQVGSLEDATAAFAAFLDEPSDNTGDDEMTTQVETVEKAVHEQAVADARAAGFAEGAAATQTRISAILGSEEAADRSELANYFAFETDMPSEKAVAALAKAPKAAAPAPATEAQAEGGFERAMDENGTPGVGANVGGDKPEAAKGPESILALARSAGIGGFTQKKD